MSPMQLGKTKGLHGTGFEGSPQLPQGMAPLEMHFPGESQTRALFGCNSARQHKKSAPVYKPPSDINRPATFNKDTKAD